MFHDCQNSFRSDRSMALLCLMENITTSIDAHMLAVGVSMDIEKAFGANNHIILL